MQVADFSTYCILALAPSLIYWLTGWREEIYCELYIIKTNCNKNKTLTVKDEGVFILSVFLDWSWSLKCQKLVIRHWDKTIKASQNPHNWHSMNWTRSMKYLRICFCHLTDGFIKLFHLCSEPYKCALLHIVCLIAPIRPGRGFPPLWSLSGFFKCFSLEVVLGGCFSCSLQKLLFISSLWSLSLRWKATQKNVGWFFFLCLRHALVLFLISLFPLSVVSTPHVVARETRLDVVQWSLQSLEK